MTNGGRKKTISDAEILALLSGDDLIYSTKEIASETHLNDRSMYVRLVDLRDEGLVDSKKIGAGLAWWLTDDGRVEVESNGDS